ncbi:MAG: hypothetical protein JWL70_3024 [Acidimicrobiia bacterium]|nr:hypothetical protein [Acidimicrobiia bacterium]
MDPLTGIASSTSADSSFGVAILKKLLDTTGGDAQTLISRCLDPQVGQNLDLHL